MSSGSVGSNAERAALALWAEAELGSALDRALGDALRRTAQRPRDGSGRVDVAAYDMALDCPARWSVREDDFAATARTTAGAVGRLALRDRREDEPVPLAVDRVLSDLEGVDPDVAWFASWYLYELDRAGRAAVRAAASTWAVSALMSVRGRRLTWVPRRQPADVRGRMIRLRTNWDASTGGAHPEVLLVMTGRPLSDGVVHLMAGFNALADSLLRHVVPLRVRVGSGAAGSTVAFAVTEELLQEVIDCVVELILWRVDPAAAPTNPGSWCRHCHLLDICPDASTDGAGGPAAAGRSEGADGHSGGGGGDPTT